MTVTIHIETDNAAFDDGCKAIEISRILKDISERLESGSIETHYGHRFGIRDVNGNFTGHVDVEV